MKFSERVKHFFGDLFDGISCWVSKAVKFIRKHMIPACISACALLTLIVLLCIFVPKISNAIDRKRASDASSVIVPSAEPIPTPTATPDPTPEPPPTPSPVPLHLVKGDRNDIVLDIQQRLMELNYMDYDEPTNYYGSITTAAIQSFQRRNGLEVTGEVTESDYSLLMSGAARTYMASLGDEGTDISEMQSRLYELDYLKKRPTGVFDSDTEDAVKQFQERNKLEVDGMVGTETKTALYGEDAIPFSLGFGDTGDDVLKYQQRLYELGYLSTEPDGKYGKDTRNAVKRFQERNDIIVDGHIGPSTRVAILSSDAKYNKLEITMSGDDVLRVKTRLYELNYLKKSEASTDYFGTVTEAAVRAFQKNNKLTVDGAVGKKTLAKLFSSDAVRSPKPVSDYNSGGNPGSNPGGGGQTAAQRIETFIAIAKTKVGCPYVRGAKGPNSFDCSGFVYWCLNKAGVKQSYMTSYMWRTTTRYRRISSMSSIKRGDVIVYRMSAYEGHVAIALGNGMMIDASSRNGKVVIRSYQTNYWHNCFYCAYRIFE